MRIGDLRHRITIQQLTPTQNGLDSTEVPADFATVWAAIEPLSGREYFAAQQVNAEVTCRIRMRYLAGVTPSMQVKFGERTFAIESVINVEERNRELQLMVKEVV
jgi:SPP1 family predicted phage head-tail adaptor